jgi:hypothetical protein
MTTTLEDLLESIDRAIAALRSRSGTRYVADIENLNAVKRVLQGLDPDEVDALLEDEEE